MAFTDNFSGESGDVELSSHTPSGGTAWTRLGTSTTNPPMVGTGAVLLGSQPGINKSYVSDDQGSADHYVQFVWKATGTIAGFVCNRLVDVNNYFGVRVTSTSGGRLELQKNATGFTLLGSYVIGSIPTNSTIRYEVEGDSHNVYLDGVLRIGPVTDATNNTETSQGVTGRTESGINIAWLDDFEAGPMAAPGTEALTGSASTGGQTAPSLTTSVPL
jgi:hypothetical protein